MSYLERFVEASDLFGDRVQIIEPHQWHLETPCDEWDVKELVNHLVYEQLWVPPLIEGQTVAEIGDRFDGDLLEDDALGAWEEATEEAALALGSDGALSGTVHLSYGEVPAAQYCDEMTLDALIHAWDLSRAIGAGEELPDHLVDWALAFVEPMKDMIESSGSYGAQLAVSADADNQTRLLALLGRQG